MQVRFGASRLSKIRTREYHGMSSSLVLNRTIAWSYTKTIIMLIISDHYHIAYLFVLGKFHIHLGLGQNSRPSATPMVQDIVIPQQELKKRGSSYHCLRFGFYNFRSCWGLLSCYTPMTNDHYLSQVVIFEDRSDAPSSDEDPFFGSWKPGKWPRNSAKTGKDAVTTKECCFRSFFFVFSGVSRPDSFLIGVNLRLQTMLSGHSEQQGFD